ncbi:MAG: hypothetical protein ACI9OU_000884 [Candidatus Promineifilaceae bacterium]|jgi:hypothetical protein
MFCYHSGKMNRHTNTFWLSVLMVLSVSAFSVQANGLLGQHTWNAGAEGWTNEFDFVDLNPSATGGNPFGQLEISFDPTGFPEVGEIEWFDVVRVDSDLLFAGNWSTNQNISFDFFSADRTPHDIQIQLHSTNGNIWSYNVTEQVTQTQTWQSVGTSLGYADAWGPLPGFSDTAEQFLSDLGDIDWVGLYIFREEASAERYGLDNFMLYVGTPEPGETVLLAAALLALFLGYRRRREDDAATQTGGGPSSSGS